MLKLDNSILCDSCAEKFAQEHPGQELFVEGPQTGICSICGKMVTAKIHLTKEIRQLLADELGCGPEEIRAAEYVDQEDSAEHFLISVEFFTAPPKWLEVDLNSDLAHLVLA